MPINTHPLKAILAQLKDPRPLPSKLVESCPMCQHKAEEKFIADELRWLPSDREYVTVMDIAAQLKALGFDDDSKRLVDSFDRFRLTLVQMAAGYAVARRRAEQDRRGVYWIVGISIVAAIGGSIFGLR